MFPEDELLLILPKGIEETPQAIHFEKDDQSFTFVDFMKVSDEVMCAVYELYGNKPIHHKKEFDEAILEARSRFAQNMKMK
jgi:hypothetical protein